MRSFIYVVTFRRACLAQFSQCVLAVPPFEPVELIKGVGTTGYLRVSRSLKETRSLRSLGQKVAWALFERFSPYFRCIML